MAEVLHLQVDHVRKVKQQQPTKLHTAVFMVYVCMQASV